MTTVFSKIQPLLIASLLCVGPTACRKETTVAPRPGAVAPPGEGDARRLALLPPGGSAPVDHQIEGLQARIGRRLVGANFDACELRDGLRPVRRRSHLQLVGAGEKTSEHDLLSFASTDDGPGEPERARAQREVMRELQEL